MKLTNTLRENRTLRNLQIGFNQLLEDQNWKPEQNVEKRASVYREVKVAGENDAEENEFDDVPLSPINQEFMDGLQEFMKYNPMLFHLDLQTTNLPA